jgi:alpha-galactosidase
MVDSTLVDRRIPSSWISRINGQNIALDLKNGWAEITQICLGNPEVVDSLKTTLSTLVERYELDWLKWDDSGLPGTICNRTDHGHGPHDGALAALTGKYEIWAWLHEKHPDVILENCGYPARLDYGLARYARAHWLSDDTSNALRCRQSQIHGSHVLPGASNTAWIVKSDELNETDPDMLDTIIRSRMIGLFGMGTLLGTLPERVSLYPQVVQQALKKNIAHYKRYRHLLNEDVYHLLPPSTVAGQWDAIQFGARDGSEAVILVFRDTSPRTGQKLMLRGLVSGARYAITGLSADRTETFSADVLTHEGLNVTLPDPGASEIYLIEKEKIH